MRDLLLNVVKGPCHGVVARELTSADLAGLDDKPRQMAGYRVARLRAVHHTMARLTAQGYKPVEVAAMVGNSPQVMQYLKDDPAFLELVAFYRDEERAKHPDVEQKMRDLLADSLTELQDRMENPEQLSTGELQDQVKILADRTGYGPSAKTQVDVRIGIAARLEAARERVKVINHE